MSSVAMLYGRKKSTANTTLNSSESSSSNITSASAEVTTLSPGSPATVAATLSESSLDFQFGIPSGSTGPQGPQGNGISSITKTGTAGLIDTYTITYTDGTSTTFQVQNAEAQDVAVSNYELIGTETYTSSITERSFALNSNIYAKFLAVFRGHWSSASSLFTIPVEISGKSLAHLTIGETVVLTPALGTGSINNNYYDLPRMVVNSISESVYTVSFNHSASSYGMNSISVYGCRYLEIDGHSVDRDVLEDEYTNDQLDYFFQNVVTNIDDITEQDIDRIIYGGLNG